MELEKFPCYQKKRLTMLSASGMFALAGAFRASQIISLARYCLRQFLIAIFALSLFHHQCLAADSDRPIIGCAESTYDAHNVEAGTTIKHSFKLSNVGVKPLLLQGSYASCSCTAAKLRLNRLPPGASAFVDVTLDTTGIFGHINRDVIVASNDPVRKMLPLTIKCYIPDPHKGMSSDQLGKKIFAGQCATCHADKGNGKMGKALYLADCAMCHGARAQGGLGPMLRLGNYSDSKVMRQAISNGNEFNPTMPAFLISRGGPLNQAQIDSIISYLKTENKSVAK
jgi:mono/diheme cytochrome c family protein